MPSPTHPRLQPTASFSAASTNTSADTETSAAAAAHPRRALGKSVAGAAHTPVLGGDVLVQSRRLIDSGALIGLHCSNTDLN